MARIAVVGAGIAGLSVAVRLADFGHDVVVLDAGQSPGGQVSTTTIDGHDVELGPAQFTLPAVFRDLFTKTGRPLERELDLTPVDPAVRFAFGRAMLVDVPNASRAGAMRAFDDALGAGAGRQWDAVVQHGERTWQSLRHRVFGTPGRGAPRRPSAGHQPPDDRVRALLGAYATAVGEDPSHPPATLTVLPYLEQTFGMWTVEGGLGRLVDALSTRARERGTTFRFGTPVTGIRAAGRRIDGVRLGDETLAADVVVSTVQPAWLDDASGASRRMLRQPRARGRSVLSVVVVARGGPLDAPRRTVVVPDGHQPVVVHRGPELATGTAWVLHAGADPHGDAPGTVDWTQPGVAEAHVARLLDAVAAGGVDVGEHANVRHVRTPHDLEQDFGAAGGRVYGRADAGVNALVRRRANTTRLRGLFLAGAGAHPGPGVPMAGISAGIVADLIGRA